MESRIEHCDLTEKNNTFERCPATITVKVIIALFANPTVHTGINRVALSGTPNAHPVDPVGLAILVRLDSLALIKKKNCENHGIYILLTSSNNQISEFGIRNILFTCLIKQ